jgi:hypothetical protein
MERMLALLIVLGTLFGCNKPSTNPSDLVAPSITTGAVVKNVLQARVGDYIYDGLGKRYKKLTYEVELPTGISKVEVWEREIPFDTKHWYTPTLTSRIFTNDPPSFNSLFRMEGEDTPFFKE